MFKFSFLSGARPWLTLLVGLLLLLSASQPLFAQAPTWQWATRIGGNRTGGSSDPVTAVDAAGNVYAAGRFVLPVVFGTTTLTSVGDDDIFVAKLTSSGAYQWAVRAGGIGNERALGIAVDGSGNVVVTGLFISPTISFGATTLTNTGRRDVFVAKLTPMGVWQWASSAGGTGDDYAQDIDVDGAGNVVINGYFDSPSLTVGTTTLSNAGREDVFVAKLTPAGAWQWATSAGGSSGDGGSGIAVDGSGNVAITGGFTSPTITFGTTTLTNAGDGDVFVAKLTPAGAWQWATGAGGGRSESGQAVAVDGSGNVVVTANFSTSTLTLGTITLINSGGDDFFVAKLTPAGAWQWAISAGGSGFDIGFGIAADRIGGVAVAGGFQSPTITCGTTTLTNSGGQDIFVAKLTPAGAWQWAIRAGELNIDLATDVAVDGSDNVVVTGSFDYPAIAFGGISLPGAISTSGYVSHFIARLSGANGLPEDFQPRTFSLYPNPASTTGKVRVALDMPAAPVRVLDLTGRLLAAYTTGATGEALLDVSTLARGLYVVRAGAATRRLVVE